MNSLQWLQDHANNGQPFRTPEEIIQAALRILEDEL